MHYWGLEGSSADINVNLARDEALLDWCEGDQRRSAIRFWEQTSPAVVLGASGRVREDVRLDHCRSVGVAVARRCSGGGTVLLAEGALNVAVVLPVVERPELKTVESAQRYVLTRLAECLDPPSGPISLQGSGDWVLDDRKCAGSAQRRLKTHVMVHATILNTLDLELVSSFLLLPKRQPAYRQGRSHQEFLTNMGLSPADLLRGLEDSWRPEGGWSGPPEVRAEEVDRLIGTKYALSSWVERF